MTLLQRSFRDAADWAAMIGLVELHPKKHLHILDLAYRGVLHIFAPIAACA